MISPVWLRLGVTAFFALAGCRRETPRPHEVEPRTPAPAATRSGAPSTPVPSAAANGDTSAYLVVRAWNDALDHHDLERLGTLYRDPVLFYGRKQSKAALVAAKRSAFARHPAFHQEIVGEISLEHVAGGSVSASFVKRSGAGEKRSDVSARLLLSPDRGGFLVVEETDAPTSRDKNAIPEGCADKAAEVMQELPEVKRALASAMAEADRSNGFTRFGGIGPNDDGKGGFRAATGIHTDERFDARVEYAVDRKGHLTVTVAGSEVKIPRTALESVARACKH
ncbi:MAG TPA: nuclear transport factor 2 family protein [Polyangiaceae bacterium]|nr:nuclear transport factor 2 family protein [Polyangiaceae bacterium]